MMLQRKVTPVEVLERLQLRLRKRIEALQGVKMPEYSVGIGELQTELDVLKRAQEYLKG